MPKILMIDDDRSLLEMTGTFLKSQGWGFAGAADAASGMQRLASEKPDLILLDINLPDMDGTELCSKLKSDPATSGIPLVLITGDKKSAEDILKGLQGSRADAYLLKPVHIAVLKAKLEAVLKPFGKV